MDSSPAGTLAELPLDQLHDSPFQPRAVYVGLEGLAESIKTDGIQQPLKVRPRIYMDGVRRGDGVRDADDTQDGYEIVFGHRRKRAAELAGLQTVPCLIVAMTDAEVRSAQMAENVQRENMRALEEATGFQAQIERDGVSQAELARRIGKSPSFVNGRLRLLELTASVRSALEDGAIGSETALLVARVGGEKLQQKALGYIQGKYLDLKDGGKQTYRRIKDLLNERFTLYLKAAVFDPEDAALLPSAGICSACPRRSGNAPEFEDILNDPKPGQWSRLTHGADVCTDPDCFDAKKRAHLKREADELQQQGFEVIDGNKARQAISATGELKDGYVLVADAKAAMKDAGDAKPAAAVVIIQNPRDGKTVKVVRRADLPAEAQKVKSNRKTSEQKRRDHEAVLRKQKAEAAELEGQIRRAVLDEVRVVMQASERSLFDLRLVARQIHRGLDYQEREAVQALHQHRLAKRSTPQDVDTFVSHADAATLTAFVLDCALMHHLSPDAGSLAYERMPPPVLQAAREYGIDVDAMRVRLSPLAAPTPSPAAQAAARAARKSKVQSVKSKESKTDNAGAAGETERDPNTLDLFEGAAHAD